MIITRLPARWYNVKSQNWQKTIFLYSHRKITQGAKIDQYVHFLVITLIVPYLGYRKSYAQPSRVATTQSITLNPQTRCNVRNTVTWSYRDIHLKKIGFWQKSDLSVRYIYLWHHMLLAHTTTSVTLNYDHHTLACSMVQHQVSKLKENDHFIFTW